MVDPQEQARTMIANLPAKTGRSLEQWLALTVPAPHEKHGQLVKWLKAEHGITHGFANLVAHETLAARAGSAPGEIDPLDAQYAGPKAALRPIYDALVGSIQNFGDDIELAPKKANVSVRRRKQFALIQPSTRTRLDLGINLPGAASSGRLEASGSFNAMVSHRVRIERIEDIDAEVVAWLREAYEAAG